MVQHKKVKRKAYGIASLRPPAVGGPPQKYQEVGIRGSSDSAVMAQSPGLNCFDLFLRMKHMGEHQDLSEEVLCDKALFREFGGFLKQLAKNDRIQGGSCGQYLSAAKTDAETRYPRNILWNDSQCGNR
jgi:hypothetical protein